MYSSHRVEIQLFYIFSPQVQTKKRPTLAKRFKCPFCANEDVVECKMDFRAGLGSLACRLCAASYQMPIHHLHEPVDVFSEWLDDCEAAAQGRQPSAGGGAGDIQAAAGGVPQYDSEDDDDDEDIPAPSGLSKGAKAPAAAASGTSANNEGGQRPSYNDLGLDDDSDDDDSD